MAFDLWLYFIPACFVLNLSPGPNNFLSMINGARFGWRRAMLAGLGRLLAFAILILLTAVGLGVALAASDWVFLVTKIFGACYLFYLGARLWRAQVWSGARFAAGAGVSLAAMARQEFWLAIGNPKAIVIFVAFFPQFLEAEANYALQFATMGATFLVLEYAVIGIYAGCGRQFSGFITDARRQKIFNRCCGVLLMCVAVALALSQR